MIMESNKRLLNEQTDIDIVNQACEVWGGLNNEEKEKFTEYTINKIGTGYPFDMSIVCGKSYKETPDTSWMGEKDKEMLSVLINREF